jgi:hypothetical protein
MPSCAAPGTAATIPLHLDLDYVDDVHDACFSWLKDKYEHLTPVTTAGRDSTASRTGGRENTQSVKATKPQLHTSLLQQLENDVAACDALRWRPFAFPSHPTAPLNSNYRNEPGKKDEPTALIAQVHKSKKLTPTEPADLSTASSTSTDAVGAARYAVVIGTRASADAQKKEKKEKKKRSGKADVTTTSVTSASPPPLNMEAVMEKIVREEEQAQQARLLGENDVVWSMSDATPYTTTSSWVHRWIPQSWRPLLGGYVCSPSHTDSARFLLFPQSTHLAVDFRDPTVPQLPPGKSLADPQHVPFFVRGSINWDVEKNNPAAAAGGAKLDGSGGATASDSHHAPLAPQHGSSGLSYSVQGARVQPAPPTHGDRHRQHRRNWADVVEVSVAAQRSRTERQYAPEREKVQRVTLLEDSAAVRWSEGDPRYSLSVTATHATVPSSGMKHQHDALPESSPTASAKKVKKSKAQMLSSTTTAPESDDTIQQLQLQDGYDSSAQYFALPQFWQRLVLPSLNNVDSYGSVVEAGTGTQVLNAVPRGRYRVRWSGGPGVEVCRAGGAAAAQHQDASSPSLITIFGKLWTESWVEVPLPWRMSLKLRTQSAITMPLEPSQPTWPPMVPDTATPAGSDGAAARNKSRLREHPYFWATQGPRWDASLVRGFKDDYSGMHHARRWYAILSAELTLNGNAEKSSGKSVGPSPPSSGGSSRSGDDNAGGGSTDAAPRSAAPGRWKNTSLTAFANACMVDTLKNFPRASVGFSFTSKIPRLTITPFNEIIPRKFECAFSWFTAFTPRPSSGAESEGSGFAVSLHSGVTSPPRPESDNAASLRVSPVETFSHMKCGLTWKFDE